MRYKNTNRNRRKKELDKKYRREKERQLNNENFTRQPPLDLQRTDRRPGNIRNRTNQD